MTDSLKPRDPLPRGYQFGDAARGVSMQEPFSIGNVVQAVIGQELGVAPEDVYSDARITTDLGADSMDLQSLVLALENEFSIEIPDHDLGELQTVRQVVHYIAVRVGNGSTAA